MTLDAGSASSMTRRQAERAALGSHVSIPSLFDKLVTASVPTPSFAASCAHDLRRRAGQTLGIDTGRDGAGARQQWQEGEGDYLNQAALKAGWDYAEANFPKQDPFHIERMTKRPARFSSKAMRRCDRVHDGRVTVVAWYPIYAVFFAVRIAIAYIRKYRVDKETGKQPSRSCRRKTRLPRRHGDWRGLGRRAR